jgi:hypothetical protein
MGGACRTYGIDEKYKALVGKPQSKRPFGRLRRIWKDNVKMDLKDTSLTGSAFDSFSSGYGPVMSCCGYDNEPSGYIKG